MIGLLAVLASATMPCLPVTGATTLWAQATRWVLVGEIHGTNEMPDAFANLVCLAAATGRPVSVALEYSVNWQPAIDAYLRSDGSDKARKTLLQVPIWHEELQDGRSSIAFLQMLDRFRRMKQAGRIAGVFCTDIGTGDPGGRTRDAGMADAWQAIPVAKNGIVLALAGNIHTMRRAIVRSNRTIATAASLMPPAQTVTINIVANGGTTWDCESDGCGEHKSGIEHPAAPGITVANGDYYWHARYELGRPTTTAPPAIAPSASPAKPVAIRITGG